jgi:hypothetical protein
MSARRMHKADREKLRRDKLNEQFSELAKALGKQTVGMHDAVSI